MTEMTFKTYKDITPEVITSLYLYGAISPTANSNNKQQKENLTITVDMKDYMTEGPGRYAKPAHAKFVRDFLRGKGNFENGIYSKEILMEKFGYDRGLFNFYLQQAAIDPKSYDFKERSYIFASTGFEVSDNAKYVVMGKSRYISNVAVHTLSDNFDFQSGNFFNQLGNDVVLKNKIDPEEIGKRVDIKFLNKDKVPAISIYRLEDLERDEKEFERVSKLGYLHVKSAMDEIVKLLWRKGIVVPAPESIQKEDLGLLMNSPAYLLSSHPNFTKMRSAITTWFERAYDSRNNDKRAPRTHKPVHVRSHTREHGKEHVHAYNRSQPHD